MAMPGSLQEFLADRFLVIWSVWILIHVLAFAFIISSLAVVGDSLSKSYNFSAIWLVLLVIAYAIGGTMVLRRFRTPLSIGFMIGSAFMFSQQMLSLAVLSGGNAAAFTAEESPASEKSVQAFAILLFLAYLVFCVLLAWWRDDVLEGAGNGAPLGSFDRVVGPTDTHGGDAGSFRAADSPSPPI